jgi:ankyrin repeat protein
MDKNGHAISRDMKEMAFIQKHGEIYRWLSPIDPSTNYADVNVQGGRYGNALQAASYKGHERVVKLLLEKIADVNAQGGKYGNALQAALSRGHMKIVKLLADIDIDLNMHGGCFGNAQEAALIGGHLRVAGLLQYWRVRW